MLRMLTREAFERRTANGARTPVYREFLADRETPVSVLSRVADGKEDVFLLMESIRSTLNVQTPGGEKLTISVGIAAAFEDANRYQELYRKAESAMFRAKCGGSNRVALCREEKMVPKTSHYTSDQLKRLTKLSKREGIGEAILLREALDMLLKRYDV